MCDTVSKTGQAKTPEPQVGAGLTGASAASQTDKALVGAEQQAAGRLLPEVETVKAPVQVSSVEFSEKGPVRAANADAVLVDESQGFYAVADGVGSDPFSTQASLIAVTAARKAFVDASARHPAADVSLAAVADTAYLAYQSAFAHRPVCPSTTLTLVALGRGVLRSVSIGDSPVFLIHDARASLLTRDHTLADQGRVMSSFTELKSMSGSNLLVNAFGPQRPRPVIYADLELVPPCRIVVSSDGLMEFLTQDELGALSAAAPTAQDLLDAIRAQATRRRPMDNYSGIIIDVRPSGDA